MGGVAAMDCFKNFIVVYNNPCNHTQTNKPYQDFSILF